jgi:hypothetical protein
LPRKPNNGLYQLYIRPRPAHPIPRPTQFHGPPSLRTWAPPSGRWTRSWCVRIWKSDEQSEELLFPLLLPTGDRVEELFFATNRWAIAWRWRFPPGSARRRPPRRRRPAAAEGPSGGFSRRPAPSPARSPPRYTLAPVLLGPPTFFALHHYVADWLVSTVAGIVRPVAPSLWCFPPGVAVSECVWNLALWRFAAGFMFWCVLFSFSPPNRWSSLVEMKEKAVGLWSKRVRT